MEISAIKDSLPGLGRCSCLLCPLLPPLLQPLWLKYLNSYMGSKRNFLWMDGAAVNDANANYLLIFLALQGTGHCTKMDNFFRELPKGGGHFWSNNLYCRFCNFKEGLLSMKKGSAVWIFSGNSSVLMQWVSDPSLINKNYHFYPFSMYSKL